MRFQSVQIAHVAYDLPPDSGVVTSLQLEERLAPLYERLNLHAGRIELMSGIRERRFYAPGTRPSAIATRAGQRALEGAAKVGIERDSIGQLIFSSVCRDFLEPASASVVHDALGLPATAMSFDLSNACLGFANSMALAASLIESRAIDSALIVAGEDGGPLCEGTVRALLAPDITRKDLKRAVASLTIGSGGAAMVLAHSSLLPETDATGAPFPHLTTATQRSATEHNQLCQGDHTEGGAMLMNTDSEALLKAGVALAKQTWEAFRQESGWDADKVERVITHQVGTAHRRALLDGVGLAPVKDHPTVEFLGNIGSVSLPITYALARESGFAAPGHSTALLGIGSGLNCSMLALETR
ncbi:MAG: 3-oxoacyl-[acyl-carrier-protein] synthase III [Bacteroidia bacterium]|jgi:3-oxoacyl-[acyl-carrier-protein] synthase III